MAKTVLHIIESLAIGGAERLLVQSLGDLSTHAQHVLVYMKEPHTLLSEVNATYTYCLNYKDKSDIVLCAIRLRRIIKKHKINLIHAHLYWPTIIARLAKPTKVPLLYTLHNITSQDAFLRNRKSLCLEKITKTDNHIPIYVSEAVKNDYEKYIGNTGEGYVLYNFVDDCFFSPPAVSIVRNKTDSIKLVAVGTLKAQKNYTYLLEAFNYLRDQNIYLDIYGEGPCRGELEAMMQEYDLHKVALMGAHHNPWEVLPYYDAFVLASAYEGFGIAVVEAMAVGLPCFLSDIDTLREVTNNEATFFDLASPQDCANKIKKMLTHSREIENLAVQARNRAKSYTKQNYVERLKSIYAKFLV